MVVLSRQDNLPNTAVEPQVCGITVVSLDIGVLPDIIENQKTGYLA
jgi:glycosyltransferase involved in cell wall biosynthesis